MPLFPGFIGAILENETNPIRFENFVIDLISASEGEVYVPTSQTYDRGRDARALRAAVDGERVIAATITRDIDPKVERDAKRLLSTTKLHSLTYCCSRDLTEDALDKIIALIRGILPVEVAVRGLALSQLRDLSMRFEEVFQKHYRAELDNLRTFLMVEPTPNDSPDLVGLRIAIRTQTGDDAGALRQDICRRLVLEQLYGERDLTARAIAAKVSARLHLPRAVSLSFLSPALDALSKEGFVSLGEAGAYRLTEPGRAYAVEVDPTAAARLLEGRAAVSESLTHLLGYALAETDFARLWAVFQDGIAELFYAHGAAIVAMVSSVQGTETADENTALLLARDRLADRVAALFQNREQHDEVRQAVFDLFSRKGTPAFEWLTNVCAVFVMMCALGLESQSASELAKILRGMTLLADTDVLLSLLCSAEPNHQEVSRVVAGWRALGGKVSAPVPALEELAYHAWIADGEYVEISDLLRTMSEEYSEYLIRNAFVRTFRAVARDPASLRQWTDFIDEFRGERKYDFSTVLEMLRGDLFVEPFPDLAGEFGDAPESFFVRVRRFLLRQAAADHGCATDELDDRIADKVRRDAVLLSTIHLARQKLKASGSLNSIVTVSSALAIRRADNEFRAALGRPAAVLSVAAVAALLALTPGVQMGVGSLKGVLFDLRLAKHLSPAQLFVYRLVARSDQYELPLARRVTLARRLRESVVDEAKKRSLRLGEVEDAILEGKDPDRSANVVKAALDKMAVSPKVADTISAQRARIRDLESQLAAFRSRNRAHG